MVQSKRLAEPASRVHGHYQDLASLAACCHGCHGSSNRGLADAPRTTDDQYLPGRDQCLDRSRPLARSCQLSSSAASAEATWRVARKPYERTNRYGT